MLHSKVKSRKCKSVQLVSRSNGHVSLKAPSIKDRVQYKDILNFDRYLRIIRIVPIFQRIDTRGKRKIVTKLDGFPMKGREQFR